MTRPCFLFGRQLAPFIEPRQLLAPEDVI